MKSRGARTPNKFARAKLPPSEFTSGFMLAKQEY